VLVRQLPFMSRPHAWVELRAWALMAVPMGMLSGGVTGVLVNTVYADVISTWALGLAVAVVTGAGPLANLFSVLWSHWSQGRDKIALLTRMQAAYGLCIAVCADAPLNSLGLLVLVGGLLGAQILWCGIITVRGSVWRANYSRGARTLFAARNQIFVSVCVSLTGATAGLMLDIKLETFRWLFIVASLFAFGSLSMLRRVKVRRQRQLLNAEQQLANGQTFRPREFLAILREDALFRTYMIWMMVFGSGNLMTTALLILVMTNHLNMPGLSQVMITAAVPTLLMAFTTPFWGRVLASRHVIAFRAINSRVFVGAMLAFFSGATLAFPPLLWLGAVLLGMAMGGGLLGWNLGHNDFASQARVTEYLGLHVTLTGIRGLLAPLIGVGLYSVLERAQPGAGVWALALPLILTSSGSLGFNWLKRNVALRESASLD